MYVYTVFIHIHMYMYVAHPFRSYFGPRSTTLYMYIYIYHIYTFVLVLGFVPTTLYNGVRVCLGPRGCPNGRVQRGTLWCRICIQYTTYTRLSWFSGLSQRPCTTAFAFVFWGFPPGPLGGRLLSPSQAPRRAAPGPSAGTKNDEQ